MRIVATALAIATLTSAPGYADTSSPSAAPVQIAPATAGQLNESQAASALDARLAMVNTKQPTEQTAIQLGAGAAPKPDPSARPNSDARDAMAAQ